MRKLPFVLTLLAPLLLVTPARAQDWAWVMSIPYALSQEQIYKVRLLDIDGVPQNELIRYAVGAGKHTFTVQMMLDVEWEPDLSDSAPQPPVKQITLEIESGRTYLLAARVDTDAPIEAQLDQSYWEPFVYRQD
jgi:hypothetical protein